MRRFSFSPFLYIVLGLGLFAPVAHSQPPAELTPLPITRLLHQGQVTVTGTRSDIGAPQDLFDGDTTTISRSASINPQETTLVFREPATLWGFRVYTRGDHRWKIEVAATNEDLQAKTGSYQEIVPWMTCQQEGFVAASLQHAVHARVARLTVERTAGDNFVHTYEWELLSVPLPPAPPRPIAPEPLDLDVTYIERLPRADYDAPKNNPAPGDAVTFRGHIKCWGKTTEAVEYQWLIDGAPVKSEHFTPTAPSEDKIVELPWTWQGGHHTVSLWVDPNQKVTEASEGNNRMTDDTDALSIGFWVEQSLYDDFHVRQKRLGIGSNSWEDWAQRQVAFWNQACEQAIWPDSPHGVLDRARLDKIVVVPDGDLPLAGGLPTNNPDGRDRTVDLMWGFPTKELQGDIYKDDRSLDASHAFFLESSLVHELGHVRYLLDHYNNDMSEEDHVAVVENGMPVYKSNFLPPVNFDIVYYNQFGGIMTGPFQSANIWSAFEAGALNRIQGKRASQGNQNAPGNIGEFTKDVPARTHIRLADSNDQPLAGATVQLYAKTDQGIDNIPDFSYRADNNGVFTVEGKPFSSIGLLRIQHQNRVLYRFLEIYAFNQAYWRDGKDDANISLLIPTPGTPPIIEVVGYDQDITNGSTEVTLQNHSDFGDVLYTPDVRPDEATRLMPHRVRVFTVRNCGSQTLHISNIQVRGAGSDSFTCPVREGSVAPGMVLCLPVTFSPQAAGIQSARIELTTNDPQNPLFNFNMQGNGT